MQERHTTEHTDQQIHTLDRVAAHVHTTREYGSAAGAALADAGLKLTDFIRYIADTELPPDPEVTPRHIFTTLNHWWSTPLPDRLHGLTPLPDAPPRCLTDVYADHPQTPGETKGDSTAETD